MVDVSRVRENLARVRDEIGPDVEICAATKYIPLDDMPPLAEAGITLVGENRAQDLVQKRSVYADLFCWDFIGALQSRKVRDVAPAVRLIHSVASESALNALAKHPARAILIQVNVAREPGKAGIDPDALAEYLARSSVPVTGLMTMPPAVERPEQSRAHFRRLAELAAEHGLEQLSMGTSQDYAVAVEEGATIVRLGSVLYR